MTNESTTTTPAANPEAGTATTADAATAGAGTAGATTASAATAGVGTAGAAPERGAAGRGRWLVAGGAVAASIAIVAGAIILLGGRPAPEALTYIPADSAVVAELRLDLPGDQLQKVGNLLAHFPGFKDQSTLPQKLDEALGKIATGATNGSVDYATQVKPWIAGPTFAAGSPSAGVAMMPNAPDASASGDAGRGAEEPGLIVATTDGTAKCEAVIPASESPTTETHQGVTILESGDGTRACALNGRIGVLGTPSLVKAALDAHAGHNGIDTTTIYRTARDTLGGDRLATVFVSKAGMLAGAGNMGSMAPMASDFPMASGLAMGSGDLRAALEAAPDWVITGVNAEDDALVADLITAPVTLPSPSGASGSSLPTMPPSHVSRTVTLVPANTLAVVDVHGAGIALRTALARLAADPNTAGALGQVNSTLAALGGPDALVGWVDDAAIAVTPTTGTATAPGAGASGGLLLVAGDDATATAKVAQLKSLLALAGLGGGQIQVHDETVGGTTMTIVDLGDVGTLLQGFGAGSAVPVPAGTHLTLALAAKGSAVIVGGDSFVRATLGVAAGASLADSAAYKHALGKASAENVGEIFLGPASAVALADSLLPEASKVSFDTDTKPYLAPFDAILVTSTLEHGGAHVRLVATVQ